MIIALVVGVDAMWIAMVQGKCRSNESRIRKYVHHYEFWRRATLSVRLIGTPWYRRLYGQMMVQHKLFRALEEV